MKRTLVITLLLILTPVFAAGQRANTYGDSKDEDAIKKVLADSVAAWNNHDARAMASLFSESADATNSAGMRTSGRGEILKVYTRLFSTVYKESHLTRTDADTKIRFIKPDVAAVTSTAEVTGAIDAQGNKTPPVRSISNMVLVKENGQWSILIYVNTYLKSAT